MRGKPEEAQATAAVLGLSGLLPSGLLLRGKVESCLLNGDDVLNGGVAWAAQANLGPGLPAVGAQLGNAVLQVGRNGDRFHLGEGRDG